MAARVIPQEAPIEAPDAEADGWERGKIHEEGIYLDMPFREYLDDGSLGSTDHRLVGTNPADYWFNSHHNPNRPARKDTPATIRGTAVHTLVLYGSTAFSETYMRGAEHTDDMTPAEKGALTKAANKRAAELRKIALTADVYDNVAIASAMIAKNPKLAPAFTGGLNEVSVFWRERDPGSSVVVPKKCRLDTVKVRGLGDLKSITNPLDKPFAQACRDRIAGYRYDVQAALYMEGRRQMARLYREGQVFGDCDADLLKRICESKSFGWQWVFWQAEGAPITHSWNLSPGNPLLDVAQGFIDRADANYRAYVDQFGLDEMWLQVEEPTELYLEEMPAWFARG